MATTTFEGRPVYTETFTSPFEKDTKGEALKVLQEIRDAHPAKDGWIEIYGDAKQLPNGKWCAFRTHQKFE